MANESWRMLIADAMDEFGENFSDVVSCTLNDTELDQEFYSGFGCHEGKPFTLWTEQRVYFPVVYDGAEWVSSASRWPDGKETNHIGGE